MTNTPPRLLKWASKFPIMSRLLFGITFVLLVGMAVSRLFIQNSIQEQIVGRINILASVIINTANITRLEQSLNFSERQLMYQPETIPDTVAKSKVDRLAGQLDLPDIRYKEAVVDARNPANEASPTEREWLSKLIDAPDLLYFANTQTETDGATTYYYYAPLTVSSESCLICHGDPTQAPPELIEIYGSEKGFGWEVGDIVAVQIVYIPSESIEAQTLEILISIMPFLLITLVALLTVLATMLRTFLIKPLEEVAEIAHHVAEDNITEEDIQTGLLANITYRQDELGELSRIMKRMVKEVYERTQKLREQIQTLKIEINQIKRKQDVEDIQGSVANKDLKAKAEQVRRKQKKDPDKE